MGKRKLTLSQLREVLPTIPFNELVGARVTKVHSDGLTVECDMREDLTNSSGFLHGGATATMVDIAVGLSLYWYFEAKRTIATVEMKVNYIRPLGSGRLLARAHLLRVGSVLSVARADLTDTEGNLVATALVTYILLDPKR